MCLIKTPKISSPAVPLASENNREALAQSDLEARLRRRRAGAAADVLTGARGIPATATMGGIAQ